MTPSTGNDPGRIFMSYRREDTAFPAGWLYDRLASHFGRDQVFKDVDSIELGDDFVDVITAAVGSCDVLLALIGDRWLAITDSGGQRRLDNPDDFVRLEIEAALTRNVRVIPILVEGARMPGAKELPESLAKLTRRQALELSPNRFNIDTQRLLTVLDRTIGEAQEQVRREAEAKAAAERRRQVGQLQEQIRERSAAQDWDAVVAASGELAALDPAAADPDGLASAAREQITRRQQAEEAAAREEAERKARERAERKAPEGGFDFDLGDLFGGTSGGGGRLGDLLAGPFQNSPRRGSDVETEATLSPADAAQGATVTLRLDGEGPCPTCYGTGAKAGTVPRVCPTCNGTGLTGKSRMSRSAKTCQTCQGRGLVVDDPCPACSGMGRATSTRTLQARIPAGVKDGQRVRVTGKGAPGLRGGPAGDLYVRVHVKP